MGNLIENKITPLSEMDAGHGLNEAWKQLYGSYPSINSLALVWAQSALETGRWKSIHNFNWGNIKRSNDEDYCMYRCNEKINGKWVWFDPPHPQTWFRAYSSATEGACDYLSFLSKRPRYQKAWEAIEKGNVYNFGHELHQAGYYTADEQQYTHGLVSLTEEFKKKFSIVLQQQSKT